jgi:hypothetical protein
MDQEKPGGHLTAIRITATNGFFVRKDDTKVVIVNVVELPGKPPRHHRRLEYTIPLTIYFEMIADLQNKGLLPMNLNDLAVEEQGLNALGHFDSRDDIFISIPKPKQEGTIMFPVRILPNAQGDKLFQYTRLHLINGIDLHCPKALVLGKKGEVVWDRNTNCPICDHYNSLWRQVDELEKQGKKAEAEKIKKEARLIKPIERYYYNAITRSETDARGAIQHNVGPKVLSVGKTVHNIILRAIRGDKDTKEAPLGDVTDVKMGYDLIIRMEIRREEEFPNYDSTSFARESSPAGKPEEVKKWVGALHDLKAIRKPATVEELENGLSMIHCRGSQ